ncbi:hypothetical protein MJG53_003170 [Ovis ammon polii x Ovis aries]|uniref:Uncharacterized protein n=1 Tax=Ovis ammon polii x Ovis aries TaxID=2918886 RepID=A0ACB9VG79_9CETA|nr:hypothetical protein MJG53_003170 [Ovis ammon polii x Ovis aries]
MVTRPTSMFQRRGNRGSRKTSDWPRKRGQGDDTQSRWCSDHSPRNPSEESWGGKGRGTTEGVDRTDRGAGALLSESCGAQSNPRGKKGFLKQPVVVPSVPSG